MSSAKLREYLDSVPEADGIRQISVSRSYHHDEGGYDGQYGIESFPVNELIVEAKNVMDFCRRHGYVDGSPILEIGCGTGRISVGLALQPAMEHLLITDPSPAFCRITQKKLAAAALPPGIVDLAVLRAEDIGLLPAGSVSLILLRSVLHHIADVEAFLQGCAGLLPPGGLLVCEEPYYEGYLLMGFVAQFIEGALANTGYACTPEERGHLAMFRDTMQFYCRRDLDKSRDEDKHLFRPDELIIAGQAIGLECKHYPNSQLTYSPAQNDHCRRNYFHTFFSSYVRYCMNWPPDFSSRVMNAIGPHFDYFTPIEAAANTVPWCFGSFVFTKR